MHSLSLTPHFRFHYDTAVHPQLIEHVSRLRDPLLTLAEEHGTPLYVYDRAAVRGHLGTFVQAFRDAGEEISVFYAMKSNPAGVLLEAVVEEGGNLDASSTRELRLALGAGAREILFTGPAKSEKDFALVLEHADRITVNLETLRELRLLGSMAERHGVTVRCGLRVITRHQGGWTKFGQPMENLRAFADEAKKFAHLAFNGIHFHISFNTDPERYVQTLEEIGSYCREHFSDEERAAFTYLDIGGGIYPQDTWEGLYPWNANLDLSGCTDATLEQMLQDDIHPRFLPLQIMPIAEFASAIASAMSTHIRPVLPNIRLYAEPGRYISQNAMHMLLRLVEKKSNHMGIADGGNNMVGWEKFQSYWYAPLFNLTHFAPDHETSFLLYGSLCTPDDIWGYYLHTATIEEGDVILLPCQGAYTYTFAQEFIREIPPVVELPEMHAVRIGTIKRPVRPVKRSAWPDLQE